MKQGNSLTVKIVTGVIAIAICLLGCQCLIEHMKSSNNSEAHPECITDISINVNIPDLASGTFPVIKIKPHNITAEEGKRFAELLFANTQFYETSIDPIMPKSVAKEKIIEWEQLSSKEVIRDIYGESRQAQVGRILQQTLENLKETDQFEESDTIREICKWEFNPESYYTPKGLNAVEDNGNNTIMAYIENGIASYKLWLTNRDEADFRVQKIYVYPNSEYASPLDIETLHMIRNMCGYKKPSTKEVQHAIDKASAIVDSVGIGKWAIVDSNIGTYKYWPNTEKPVYVIDVTAVPSYDGINTLHVKQLESLRGNDAYAANYYYSEFILTFSSNGDLIEATLTSPVDTVSVVDPNVDVIDIQESIDILTACIEKNETVMLRNFYLSDRDGYSISVNIDDVELGLARIRIEDDPYNFYLTPAIQFSGDYTIMLNDQSIYSYRDQCGGDYEFATINLVDGSIINTGFGY